MALLARPQFTITGPGATYRTRYSVQRADQRVMEGFMNAGPEDLAAFLADLVGCTSDAEIETRCDGYAVDSRNVCGQRIYIRTYFEDH